MHWSVIVPIKTTSLGKSRLEGTGTERPALALAIALDTVEAAARAERVREVIAVTSDTDVQAGVDAIDGARWIPDPGMGLNGAVRAGLEHAAGDARAALLGDLPALTPSDLDAALDAAARHERAFVSDAERAGSTLVAWSAPATYEARFGAGSAQAHAEAGFVPLDVPLASTVRRDADTLEQLRACADLGLGPRTRALLAASA